MFFLSLKYQSPCEDQTHARSMPLKCVILLLFKCLRKVLASWVGLNYSFMVIQNFSPISSYLFVLHCTETCCPTWFHSSDSTAYILRFITFSVLSYNSCLSPQISCKSRPSRPSVDNDTDLTRGIKTAIIFTYFSISNAKYFIKSKVLEKDIN